MLSRTATAAVAQRSHAQRRIRRHTGPRLYCATNGCTTTLSLDPATGRATCPICGYSRLVS